MSVLNELLADSPVLTDGAWGTELQARGLPIGGCPDSWNLTRPEEVESVARSYVEAGSRIILTNTFGSNVIALERHGASDDADSLNRAGVAISLLAARGRARVFASMGPTGRSLSAEEVSVDHAWQAFVRQARVLAESGAEAIVIETMTDLEEARLAVSAALQTGLPVIACMTLDSGSEYYRTGLGVTVNRAAMALEAAGANAIGINCGRGPKQMVSACRKLKDATSLPIWIKPNAGLPTLVDGRALYAISPDEYSAECVALVDAGADFIGGCCGTSGAHIRVLRVLLNQRSSRTASAYSKRRSCLISAARRAAKHRPIAIRNIPVS